MNKRILNFLHQYLKKYKYRYLIGIAFVLLASLISISNGYLNGLGIEKVSAGEYKIAIFLFILFFAVNMIKSFLRKWSNKIFQKISNNAMEDITYNVFQKIGLLPVRAFEEKSSGEYINRVTNDSTNIISNFNQLIWIGTDLMGVIVISIYILINSWVIFFEIIIFLFLYYFFTKKYLPVLKENEKKIKADIDKTTSRVNEAVRGVREIRALGIRKLMNKRAKNDISSLFQKRDKVIDFTENYSATVRNMNNVLESGIYITCIILLINNSISLTFLIAMTWYVYRFLYLFESISGLSTSFQSLIVSAERILEILDNKTYDDMEFGTVSKNGIGSIRFNNVSFKYSDDENYVLKNFNLEIEKNKVTALVGKSGGGKSTIFNLILRYFDVKEGEILLDDINIKDLTENSLQKNISIIRQEPFLFNQSILENFRVLDNNVSLKEVREYCKMSEIDDYIMSLPKKYDTIIGEGGVNLSGGQKQRMAIARALMKKSSIILFDEATSALDNVNQEKIKRIISKLAKNHTIVIVAHRLSTIIDADKICLIEHGKIKAEGKHSELIKTSKEYQNLYANDNMNV